MKLKYLLIAASMGLAANANAVVTLTLNDVSNKDTNNPEDIQCIIFGNSCPGGFQDMSALNYAQGGNVSEFNLTADANQAGNLDAALVNPYTVGYLSSFVGSTFGIGIDVNTAGGQPAERLIYFAVQVDSGGGYVTEFEFDPAVPASLDPAFNGNGYFDFTLELVDLSGFADTALVRFIAHWDQATDGAENFFVYRGGQVFVAEPETYTLLLSGLALIGFAAVRRRRRSGLAL